MMKQYYPRSLHSISKKHNRERVYTTDEEMLGLSMYKCNLSIIFLKKKKNTRTLQIFLYLPHTMQNPLELLWEAINNNESYLQF